MCLLNFIYKINYNEKLMSSGNIYFNSYLTNDISSKYWIYFSESFGNSGATIINDSSGNPINGNVNGNSSIFFTFDYTGNTQGGRTPNTDANYTAVAIGSNIAQYVISTGAINSGETNNIYLYTNVDWSKTGSTSTSGTSGSSGVSGTSGSSGESGSSGKDGMILTSTPYKYSNDTTPPPSSRYVEFNNVDIPSSTIIYINDINNNNIDISNYLSIIKTGDTLYLQNTTDSNEFFVFQVNGNTPQSGYKELDITFLNSGLTTFVNQETILISFSFKGVSGTSGTSGLSGSSGTSGMDGTSGSSGTSGIGISGSSGTSGQYSSIVMAQNTGYTITVADAFSTFTCNSTSTQTFNLPSVDTAQIGIEYTVVKLGTGAVIIDAADSDLIEDSGAGATIYCADDGIATIRLKLVTATQWVIFFANGIWITTA